MWNFNVSHQKGWWFVFFLAGSKCFKTLPREQNVAVTLKIMHLICYIAATSVSFIVLCFFIATLQKIHLLSKQYDGLYISTHLTIRLVLSEYSKAAVNSFHKSWQTKEACQSFLKAKMPVTF